MVTPVPFSLAINPKKRTQAAHALAGLEDSDDLQYFHDMPEYGENVLKTPYYTNTLEFNGVELHYDSGKSEQEDFLITGTTYDGVSAWVNIIHVKAYTENNVTYSQCCELVKMPRFILNSEGRHQNFIDYSIKMYRLYDLSELQKDQLQKIINDVNKIGPNILSLDTLTSPVKGVADIEVVVASTIVDFLNSLNYKELIGSSKVILEGPYYSCLEIDKKLEVPVTSSNPHVKLYFRRKLGFK